MTRYILDTDHVTLLQRLHPLIRNRVETIKPENVSVTVVTVAEQMRGWLDAIRQASQASQPERLLWAYTGLRDSVKFLNSFDILNFSPEASNRFAELRRQKIRIGTQDLRIAAIVLAENGILLTRNQHDFSQVPGLIFQDWTIRA